MELQCSDYWQISGGNFGFRREILYALSGQSKEATYATVVGGSVCHGSSTVVHDGRATDCPIITPVPQHQLSRLKGVAFDEVALALEMVGDAPGDIEIKSRFFLSFVGLRKYVLADVNQLSGGQTQLLNFAGALVAHKRLLLLESAFEELAPATGMALRKSLRLLAKAQEFHAISIDIDDRGNKPSHATVVALPWIQSAEVVTEQFLTAEPAQTLSTAEVLLAASNAFLELRSEKRPLCSPFSFELRRGELKFVVGFNGAGKTAFVRSLCGIGYDSVELRGQITLMHQVLDEITHLDRRNWLSVALQNAEIHFCRATVQEELDLGKSSDRSTQAELLESLALENVVHKNPMDLSRSEQKRLSVVLAAQSAAPLMLLDEPTLGCSEDHVRLLVRLMRRLCVAGKAILCVTHDPRLLKEFDEAERVTLRVPNLAEGTELQTGSTDDILGMQLHSGLRNAEGNDQTISSEEELKEYWRKVHDRWPEYMLDINAFRHDHLCPWLDRFLAAFCADVQGRGQNSIELLDLGCGNGLMTAYTRAVLDCHFAGRVTARGVDWVQNVIDVAHSVFGGSEVQFEQYNLYHANASTSPRTERGGRIACSYFVLHDMARIDPLLVMMADHIGQEGVGIAIVIHPGWATLSSDFSISPLDSEPTKMDADAFGWATIAGEKNEALRAPFFFRTFATYGSLAARAGMEICEVVSMSDGRWTSAKLAELLGGGEAACSLGEHIVCAMILKVSDAQGREAHGH